MKILGGLISSMDFSAIAPNTKLKGKRERQPNWTEAEKQLLLSLTRKHQVILENKCSDTMTIKKKSEAWDDIAAHMRAAGYQRSKDRLKQQLGRMRAAEAKRARDAIAKSQTQDQDNSLVTTGCSSKFSATKTPINRQVIQNMPAQMHEVEIKIEKSISLEEFGKPYEKQSNKEGSEINGFSSTSSRSPTPHSHELSKRTCEGSRYLTLNPLFVRVTDADESERQLPISSTSSNCRCNCSKKKLRNVRLRINGHSPRTRAQRARQLHLYRVAVEKERLKMLRMQQKRDRIFYQKDKQIQNLKLQILRNLAVNRVNHINFN